MCNASGSGEQFVIKTKKLLPQNHMTSCARAATYCANGGFVSIDIQEDDPQPTLQTLLYSLLD